MIPFPIVVALLLCFTGAYFVTSGLLSRRPTFTSKSQCQSRPVEPLFIYPTRQTGDCWLPTLGTRNVLVLIDALRHDFVERQDSSFTFVKRLIEANQAHYSVFLSDPPTTTSQRVVGISCGSFPTYLESFLNFNAESLKGSDSFIHQLWAKYSDKCFFYGDNTWTELYPFMNEHGNANGYHSFNMFDLHFVDQSVYTDLSNFYNKNLQDDFSFLTIHLLGLDHAGHTFDAGHPAIQAKLAEYDQVVSQLCSKLPSDTNFFVFGDHGMTNSGDHGGESWDEIATCLVHFNSSWTGTEVKRFEQYDEFLARVASIRRKYSKHPNGISQVDFCSTLSFVAGVPVPFENVGSIIPEILVRSAIHQFDDDVWVIRFLLDAVRMQLVATTAYLKVSNKLNLYHQTNSQLAALDSKLESPEDMTADELQDIFLSYFELSQQLVEMLRSSMVEIDFSRMKKGIIFIAFACTVGVCFVKSWNLFLCCVIGSLFSFAYISNSHIASEFAVTLFLLNVLLFSTLLFNQNEMRKLNRILTLFFIAMVRFGANISQSRGETSSVVYAIFLIVSASIAVYKTNIFHPNVFFKWALCMASGCIELFLPSRKFTVQKVALLLATVFLHSTPSVWLECIITLLQRPVEAVFINNILIIARVLMEENYNLQKHKPLFLSMLAWYLFGATGHSYQVSSIQWDRVFFAIEGYFPRWNASVVLLNSFGSFLLPFCLEPNPRYLYFIFVYEYLKLLFCSLCVFMHARHLMSFAIFIPRFLLQSFTVATVSLAYCVRSFLYNCRK